MGIWEFIGSTAESVKRNAPDATPLKIACRNYFNYGSAALAKLDQAVRIDGVYQLRRRWIPDDETKSKIGLYSTKFAKNAGVYAIQEGYKLIPGGVAFSKILSKTMHEVEYENLEAEKLKLSEKKEDIPHKHLDGGGRRLIDGAEMQGSGGVEYSVSKVLATDKSPEDVIRSFMMKEFFGARFFDDLMVHESARATKGKKKTDN
ncbi:hypothetical protein ABFS83_08G181500 [Erythranthe nasuta]